MKILAKHKWISGCVITESCDGNNNRRFTATINGFRNFKIFEGKLTSETVSYVQNKVRSLRDRIDSGDETPFNS